MASVKYVSLRKHTNKGFTIVELLVVVVVMGILAGLIMVGYNAVVVNANDTTAKSALSKAQTALEEYYRQHRHYPNVDQIDELDIISDEDITYNYLSTGQTYCLDATSIKTQHSFFISSTTNTVSSGACDALSEVILQTDIIAVGSSHVIALTSSGKLYGWGAGHNGQLGPSTTYSTPTPIAIAIEASPLSGRKIVAIAAGSDHSLAVDADGAVYAWGRNDNGQLGDDSTSDSPTPVAVVTSGTPMEGKKIVAVSAGMGFSVALASDGTLYSWGLNTSRELGNGTTTTSHKPVAVTMSGTPMAGKKIIAISSRYRHTLALDSNGAVYGWGVNSSGELGNGNSSTTSVPVAVNTTGTPMLGKVISRISAGSAYSLALSSDGSLYAWGLNSSGQLGEGTTNAKNKPVAVNTATIGNKPMAAIAAGANHNIALDTSGVVYSWGSNSDNQLGRTTGYTNIIGAVTISGSALQDKTVKAVHAGGAFSTVLAADGRVYSWGTNTVGQLAIGSASVGSLTPVLALPPPTT